MVATIEQAVQAIDTEWACLAATWADEVVPGGYLPLTRPDVAADMHDLAERSSSSPSL